MGAVELAKAFEDARAQQCYSLLADVLTMQGVAATHDELRAFHSAVPDGVVREPVVYGAGSERDLTGALYRPAAQAEPLPGVVLIHGGGWSTGHANIHARHAAYLAADGFVALTINYRLMQEAPWPAALDDALAAVRWLRMRDEVDNRRIGVTGSSAGGHLAAMVATRAAIRAAVLWYPVPDLTLPSSDGPVKEFLVASLAAYLGDVSPRDASPGAHIGPNHPPVLTIVGDADQLTPAADARALHRIYERQRVDHELAIVPGGVHGFEAAPADWQWSYEKMRDYFRAKLG